jgi:hypothetical protein
MAVLEQLVVTNKVGATARQTKTFRDITAYYTQINALYNLVFPLVHEINLKKMIVIQNEFEFLEFRIRLGRIPSSEDMLKLYKYAESLQREITFTLQQLKFFFRTGLRENKGMEVLRNFGQTGVFKSKNGKI